MNRHDKHMVLALVIVAIGVGILIAALPYPFNIIGGVACVLGGSFFGSRA